MSDFSIFSSGLNAPEGPVVLPDGSLLVAEMGPDRGCVTRISPDGSEKKMIARTGRPNGLALDASGTVWIAESRTPSLLRMTMEGKVELFLSGCNGEPFLFPNDLAFAPDGSLYMTDSGILIADFAPGGKVRADYKTLSIDGRVYRIDTGTGRCERIDSGILFPNGIAFGPDDFLYVNETLTGNVYRYRWEEKNVVGARERFGNVIDPNGPDVMKGPDGMKFGADSSLYVTVFGQSDVTVLGQDGYVVNRIKTRGKLPTNLAFGLPGTERIYITEDEFGAIEVYKVRTEGFRLYR
ncbi:MAG: SMP-30/gluconolactonase/LRE family protein [Spirochaetota bacterium]